MANIPEVPIPSLADREPTGISVNPSGFGQSDAALARFGSDFAETANRLLEKRKRYEDSDFAQRSSVEDTIDSEQAILEIKATTPPDGENYSKRVRDYVQSRISAQAEKAPSEDAKREYYSRIDAHFAKLVVDAELEETAKRSAVKDYDLQQQSNGLASTLLSYPDLGKAHENYKQMETNVEQAVAEKRLNPGQAKILLDKIKVDQATGYYHGLHASGQYEKALAFLSGEASAVKGSASQQAGVDYVGKTPEQALEDGNITKGEYDEMVRSGATEYRIPAVTEVDLSGMNLKAADDLLAPVSVEKRSEWVEQTKKAMLAKHGEKTQDLLDRISNFKAGALKGDQIPEKETRDALINELAVNKSITPQKKAELKDDLDLTTAFGVYASTLRTIPESQWDKGDAQVMSQVQGQRDQLLKADPSAKKYLGQYFNERSVQATQGYLESVKDQIRTEKRNAPATFVVTNYPDLQNLHRQAYDYKDPVATQKFISSVIAREKYLGIAQQPIPEQDAKSLRAFIKSEPNGDQKAAKIGTLQVATGKYFPSVWTEVAAKDKELQKYTILANVADPESRARIVDVLHRESDITTKFKAGKQSENELKAAVNQRLQDFTVASTGGDQTGNRLPFVNSMQKSVELYAMKQMIDGVDQSDAVDRAVNLVVGSNYQIASGGRSKAIVPNSSASSLKRIEAFQRSHSTEEAINRLSPMLNESVMRQWKAAGIPESEWLSRWGEYVSKSVRWTPNDARTGLQGEFDSGNGRWMKLYRQDGRPMEFTFDEISNPERGLPLTYDLIYKEEGGMVPKMPSKAKPAPKKRGEY